jgi:hypothetical protein
MIPYFIPLSRRSAVAMSVADFSSRSLPARGLRNVPDSESDESFTEVVEVKDPHHPLWGRSYRVIRKIG